MKTKLLCISLLLASSATNAAEFGVYDAGKALEQRERIEAMRQERAYREMQLQQQRQQQQRQEQQFQQQRAEQERQQQQLQDKQVQQQQQSRPTGKACMKDCREAGYKYSECRVECAPK
jgi:Skp family chaperone for outer membrane proteins